MRACMNACSVTTQLNTVHTPSAVSDLTTKGVKQDGGMIA